VKFKEPILYKRFLDAHFEKRELSPIPNWHPNNVAVIDWFRFHTRPEDAVLARFGTSPMVLAYADRPIIIQSKIENSDVRERIRGFLDAVYAGEDAFYDYCVKNGASYYLYEAKTALDDTIESDRYVAGRPRLRRDSAAYLFQFAPERLVHFTPVFQNSFYRIYAIHPAGKGPARPPLADEPTYDLSLYGTQEGPFFDDGRTPAVMKRLDDAVALYIQGERFFAAGALDQAVQVMRAAMDFNPGVMGLQSTLGFALCQMGRTAEGLPLLAREAVSFPDFVEARYKLGIVLANSGRIDDAFAEWNEGLKRAPNDPRLTAASFELRRFVEGRRPRR
jgi:tetratricopeptide (TPR) repeat protein